MIEPSIDIIAQKENGGGVKPLDNQFTTLVERIFFKLPALATHSKIST
jgi:hypothetical protein